MFPLPSHPHLKKLQKGRAKRRDDVVDLGVQVVGPVQRPPARKDGVGDLEHADVDLGVRLREAADEVLRERLPAGPKVRVGNDADALAELDLDRGRARNHEPDELLLDDAHLFEWQLVLAVLVDVARPDKVFERERRREPRLERERRRVDNVEQVERVALLLRLGLERGLGLAVLAAVQRRVQQLRNLPDLGRHREGRVGGDGVVSVGRGARGRPSVVR
jgi:hypothetical protein